MGHQVPDEYRAVGRAGLDVRPGAADVDPGVGERGQVVGDRVVQGQQALLHEQQRGDRGDGLRHGVDPPQGVGLDREPGRDVAPAVRREVGDAPAPGDGDEEARQTPLVDQSGEVPVQAAQHLRIQPGLTRIDLLSQLCHGSSPVARSSR